MYSLNSDLFLLTLVRNYTDARIKFLRMKVPESIIDKSISKVASALYSDDSTTPTEELYDALVRTSNYEENDFLIYNSAKLLVKRRHTDLSLYLSTVSQRRSDLTEEIAEFRKTHLSLPVSLTETR